MASLLGKRKRTNKAAVSVAASKRDIAAADAEENAQELQDIFRRAFEAKFKPLVVEEEEAVFKDDEDLAMEADSDNDWDGLSADDEEDEERPNQVQVVEHGTIAETEALTRAEMKAFMVCCRYYSNQRTTLILDRAQKCLQIRSRQCKIRSPSPKTTMNRARN
jgi:hypothetical protein